MYLADFMTTFVLQKQPLRLPKIQPNRDDIDCKTYENLGDQDTSDLDLSTFHM